MNRLSSRKFLVLLTILIYAGILIWVGKLTGGEWLTLMTLVFSAYIAGNVYEKNQGGPAA